MNYSSLEQRLARGYIDMLPSFIPDKNAPVSVSEQEHFYTLIKALFRLAYEEPLLFVASLHEDDSYPSRYKKGYGKSELIENMKKFTKPVDELLRAMFLFGQGGEVKLNKRQAAVLSKLGINDLTNLPAAWKWMATKDGANVQTFSHCLFENNSIIY